MKRPPCANCAVLLEEIKRLKHHRMWHLMPARNRAIELYKEGKSTQTIGKELGIHHSTIFKWVSKAGIARPRRRNERYAQALGMAIAAVRDQGMTIKAAATNFDLGYATIRRHCLARGIESRYQKDRKNAKGFVAGGRRAQTDVHRN
jgi:transposase